MPLYFNSSETVFSLFRFFSSLFVGCCASQQLTYFLVCFLMLTSIFMIALANDATGQIDCQSIRISIN